MKGLSEFPWLIPRQAIQWRGKGVIKILHEIVHMNLVFTKLHFLLIQYETSFSLLFMGFFSAWEDCFGGRSVYDCTDTDTCCKELNAILNTQ